MAFQVAGLLLGPWLIARGGMNALLLAFMSLNVVAAVLARWLPADAARAVTTTLSATRLWTTPTLLALCGSPTPTTDGATAVAPPTNFDISTYSVDQRRRRRGGWGKGGGAVFLHGMQI